MGMDAMTNWVNEAQQIHSERLAEARALLLDKALPLAAAAEPAAQALLARVAEHVLLGHQADAAALEGLLARLPAACAGRGRAAIALAEGRQPDWQDLAPAERIRAHGSAVLALSRRRDFAAMQGLIDAMAALAQGAGLPARQALAAQANNIAADLRAEHRRGDAPHAALMLGCARLARSAWAEAGGWLETERADWQLAMCAAAAGDGALALTAAEACLARCQAEGADAFEHFFAYEALAWAQLASGRPEAARSARAQMDLAALAGEDRAYGRDCLAALDQALGAPA